MRIAVLGAGPTGLTAAYHLVKRGCEVVIFEKEACAGGLTSGFKNEGWEWPLERFYHHFFSSDHSLMKMCREIGLGSKLFFKKPLTSTYYQGQISPLDSPLALLKFSPLTPIERLRTGLVLAYLKIKSNHQTLEQKIAAEWLRCTMGENSFKILWEPLLISKFGEFAHQISAAWFWARIKKRSRALGYIEGSFQALTNRLVEKIEEKGGKVFLNREVKKIEKQNSQFTIYPPAGEANNLPFDIVVSTLPTSAFLKITPDLPQNYRRRLSQIPHLWAQTLILEMNKGFLDDTYWLNINDTSFPFLAVVEHTNFIDKSHYGGHYILYVGNYLPNHHPYLKKSPKELLEIFEPYLKKINPDFSYKLQATSYQLFSAPSAQPVITAGYQPPALKTPVKNLYLANMASVYPWDRETNYAIELGEKVAKLVI